MKKNIKKILICFFTLMILGGIGTAAYAATIPYKQPVIPQPQTLPGPISTEARKTLTEGVLPKLAIALIGTVAALSLLFLVIAGVRYAMVYGNDEAAQNAKKQIIYAIAGLIIALMSWTIVAIITRFNYEEFSGPPPAGSTQGPSASEAEEQPNDAELEPEFQPEPSSEAA